MAKAAKNRGTGGQGLDVLDDDALPGGEDEDIFRAFSDLESVSGSEIWVWRRDKETNKLSWVMNFPVGEMTIGQLLSKLARRPHSGGTFKVQIRNANGQVERSRVITIEDAGDAPTEPEAAAKDGGVLAVFQKHMEDSNRRMDELNTRLVEALKQPAKDPYADLEKLAGVVSKLSGGGSSTRNLVEEMNALDELVERRASRTHPAANDEHPAVTIGREVLNALTPIVNAVVTSRMQPVAAVQRPVIQHQPAAGETVNANGNVIPAETPAAQADGPDLSRLKPQLQFLDTMAAADADPLTYAQMMLDNTPLEARPVLLQLVKDRVGTLAKLAAVVPTASQHEAWWNETLDEVWRLLDPNTAPPAAD